VDRWVEYELRASKTFFTRLNFRLEFNYPPVCRLVLSPYFDFHRSTFFRHFGAPGSGGAALSGASAGGRNRTLQVDTASKSGGVLT